jgi:MORC family CW-type zinc finger protein
LLASALVGMASDDFTHQPPVGHTHVQHATTHPKFLNSNSTSHAWAFGAVAELIDNAQDPDVMADTLHIDCCELDGHVGLVFSDNGLGLERDGLHKMLSFGHSEKTRFEIGRHQAVGRYGNGFKSGSMRLGSDALVLTRSSSSQSVGLLSQTFLREIGAEEILVPMVSWNLAGERLSEQDDQSLAYILEHSLFGSEKALLAALGTIHAGRETREAGSSSSSTRGTGTGTRVFIWRLRGRPGGRNPESGPELDFATDRFDIRITSEGTEGCAALSGTVTGRKAFTYSRKRLFQQGDVPIDYSLKAYAAILYKVPRMRIFVRGAQIRSKRASSLLARATMDRYTPHRASRDDDLIGSSLGDAQSNIRRGTTGQVGDLDEGATAIIEMGWGTDGRLRTTTDDLYGMHIYHRNRLIMPYLRVGMQEEPNEKGIGVLGIVQADFLTPTHDKQGFNDTKLFRNLRVKLADQLRAFWWTEVDSLTAATLRTREYLPSRVLNARFGGASKRARPSGAMGTGSACAAVDDDEARLMRFLPPSYNWVQCSRPSCQKWRILPQGVSLPAEDEDWACSDNPDVTKAQLGCTPDEDIEPTHNVSES